MSATPETLPHGKMFGATAPFSFHARIRSGVVLFVPTKDAYRAILLARRGSVEADAGAFARAVRAELGDLASTVKLIGFEEPVRLAAAAMRASGYQIAAEVIRPCPFEITYDAAAGRLRVSAENRIKVLIIDDSVSMRRLLRHLIESDPQFVVSAEAARPSEVEGLILKDRPDVLTVDINMPEMNGVELLSRLVPKYKLPAVLVSSLSKEESPLVLAGLEAGAVDYLQKPEAAAAAALGTELTKRLRIAANARVFAPQQAMPARVVRPRPTNEVRRPASGRRPGLIAIGSSTGGTEALRAILTELPADIPPIVIAQHIPGAFSGPFADRLDTLCAFPVAEAQGGEVLESGRCYIAPGGRQMRLAPGPGGGLCIHIDDNAEGSLYKPSVDNLLNSVARYARGPVIGVILTGMGADGARGLQAMKARGAQTIAQDEETSVIFGMPAEAIKTGAVDHVVPLGGIAALLQRLIMADAPAA